MKDSSYAYHDPKSGVYFNDKFWNIKSEIRDKKNTLSDEEFTDLALYQAAVFDRLSPPPSPSSRSHLPLLPSSPSTPYDHTPEPESIKSEEKIKTNGADSSSGNFTLRLERKKLSVHPSSRHNGQQLASLKGRPHSAAVSVKIPGNISKSHSLPPPSKSSWQKMCSTRYESEPQAKDIAASAITLPSKKILNLYIYDDVDDPVRTRAHPQITPSSLSFKVDDHKRKAWACPQKEKCTDTSELTRIFELSSSDSSSEKRAREKYAEDKAPRKMSTLERDTSCQRSSVQRKQLEQTPMFKI